MDIITKILQGALLNAQHQDDKIRSVAQGKLKELQDENLPNFLLSLAAELSSDASPPECKRLAGSILKNLLDERCSANGDQWINLDQLIKFKIKESLLVALGSLVPDAWHASSQVIAKVAYIEIPRREWPDLIEKLLANMVQGASPPLKQGTLEALGYVIEEILGLDPDELKDVLNVVIQAMNQAELSSEVRLAAVKALQNILKHSNFANDDCGNLIMSAICDTAESDEAKMIKREAFGCLVVIASKYYMMLEPYMETILSLTTEALEGGVESGTLQCIEFWITICKKVIEVQEQNKRFANAISTADCHFIENSLSSLVPILLNTLLNQEGDDDAQGLIMSSTTCLGLVARTIGDAIVPLVMQFVEGNIKASDWQSREAATSALGVILEGPSIEKLAPVVGLLMGRMEDPTLDVRVTAAFTLGRAFELLHSPALGNRLFANEDLRGIMVVLTKSCEDVPEVSEEICEAIYFLARGYESTSSELGHSKKKISSELSPFLGALIDVLFSASELAKETPFRLPASESAYKALSEVVRVSNMQDYPSVAIRGLMPRTMRRLNMVLETEASSSGDKRNKYDLLVLMCGVLHVIIQKLATSRAAVRTVTESARYLLLLFCRVLTCECSTARDKAALAIGALADATGPDFVDNMPILLLYFNVERLFPIYLQVVGNIFHVFGERTLPYCDDIMDVLYKGLSKSELKSSILECFGVIALAIGKNFEKYLQVVMEKLKEAANPRYYANDIAEDKVDYGNQLRQAIFKAYSGILRGIKDPISRLKVATGLFEFTEAVCKDQRRGAILNATAVDVLSEFASMAESWSKGLILEVTK